MKKITLGIFFTFLFFISCTQSKKPRLVVYIVSDQLTPGLLNEWDSLFTGGFRWLKDNGINYTNTFHNHGKTNTGNGHFALSTSVYPGRGGIVSNDWYDRGLKRAVNVVEDTSSVNFSGKEIGRSFKNINFSSLADWLKDTHPKSKVVSLSGKDRGSILMAGRDPDLALWYDKDGGYTSSTYYLPALPVWVSDFNKNLNVPSYKDSIWSRLKDPQVYLDYARADDFKGEKIVSRKKGAKSTLPLNFGEMSLNSLLNGFYEYPQGDRSLIDLAIKSVSRFKLGQDIHPDILFLGLSATDGVGHHFGPRSVEQLDNYLRSDKNLMHLIDYIEKEVGLNDVLFILTGDHGVMELPEYLQSQNISSGRIPRLERKKTYFEILEKINQVIGTGNVVQYGDAFYFNKELSIEEKEIAIKIIKNRVKNIEGVREALSQEDILSLPPNDLNNRLKNMIHPDKSPNVYVILKENWLWKSDYGSSHGSHYDYDSHVPFIMSKSSTAAKIISSKVRTVDIPATIAKILDLKYPDDIDGEALSVEFIQK